MDKQNVFTYIINDQTVVNRYGYRILNSGILYFNYLKSPTVRYMHNGEIIPIGKCLRIFEDGNTLKAEVELDATTDFEKLILDKVQRGVINAISMGHNPLAFDETNTIVGQTKATVTKTDLLELSIVDAPGNSAAIRVLSATANTDIPLLNKTKKMNEAILKQLGLSADATDEQVMAAIDQLKAEKEAVRIDAYLAAKVQAGVITTNEVEKYSRLCAADFEAVKGLLDDKQPVVAEKPVEVRQSLAALIKEQQMVSGSEQLSFEQLSKNDPKRLLKIKQEQPELYKKLLNQD